MAYSTVFSNIKSTVGSPYVLYTVSYELGQRKIDSQIYNIKVDAWLQYPGSFLDYDRTLDDYISINGGTFTSFNIKDTAWSGTSVHTTYFTYEASVNNNPNIVSFKFYVDRSDTLGHSGELIEQSSTVACGYFAFNSVFNNLTDFTFDEKENEPIPFNVPITKNLSTYYDVLSIKCNDVLIAKREGFISGEVKLSLNELSTAYSLMNDANTKLWTFELESFENIEAYLNRTVENPNRVGEVCIAKVNASISPKERSPVFSEEYISFVDTGEKTQSLTLGRNKFIFGYSTLKVTLSNKAYGRKGASLGNKAYLIESAGVSSKYISDLEVFPVSVFLENITNNKFLVGVTDSRGNTLVNSDLKNIKIEKDINLISYLPVNVSQIGINRCNLEGQNDLTGTRGKVSLNGNFTSWSGLNANNEITYIGYIYKEKSASWSEEAIYEEIALTSLNFSEENASFSLNHILPTNQVFDVDKEYDFKFKIKDKLSEISVNAEVLSANPTLDINVENRNIAVGKVFNSKILGNGNLDINGGIASGLTGSLPNKFIITSTKGVFTSKSIDEAKALLGAGGMGEVLWDYVNNNNGAMLTGSSFTTINHKLSD